MGHEQDLGGGIHLDLLLEGQRLHVHNPAHPSTHSKANNDVLNLYIDECLH